MSVTELERGAEAEKIEVGSGMGLNLASTILKQLNMTIAVEQGVSEIPLNGRDYYLTCFKVSIPREYFK